MNFSSSIEMQNCCHKTLAITDCAHEALLNFSKYGVNIPLKELSFDFFIFLEFGIDLFEEKVLDVDLPMDDKIFVQNVFCC